MQAGVEEGPLTERTPQAPVPVAEIIPFGGDWDLLRVHISVHAEVVDRFVLVEGDLTYSGQPREPRLAGLVGDLPVEPARVRLVTLPLSRSTVRMDPGRREMTQTDGGFIGVADLSGAALVLITDVDEIIEPAYIRELAARIDVPERIRLRPHYQFIDRLAPGWHCCEGKVPPSLRRPGSRTSDVFAYAGPVACRRADLGPGGDTGPAARRRATSRVTSAGPHGWHLTGVDPSSRDGHKERSVAHAYRGRIVDPDHMRRCSAAGVHHQGWWYVSSVDPAAIAHPVLERIRRTIPGTISPSPLPPWRVRRAIRAWSEIRQFRRLPEPLVAAVDRRLDRRGLLLTGALATIDRLLVRLPRPSFPQSSGVHEHLDVADISTGP